MAEPDLLHGIDYWTRQPASLDGVLGGFGSGSLPRIDALGSRQFLLNILPELSTVPSALRPLAPPPGDPTYNRTRALDVGAGIGRVTSDVLLHLVSDIVLLEPVESFVHEAYARGKASRAESQTPQLQDACLPWKGIADGSRSVTFLQGTLQYFDPAAPLFHTKCIGRVGYGVEPDSESKLPMASDTDIDSGFDIIWCQWCLGHMRDIDLVAFFRRCKHALRNARSVIVVKENVCAECRDGTANVEFDDQDSSVTRSDKAWKQLFAEAGLNLFQERLQLGLPAGLYAVKMYALR